MFRYYTFLSPILLYFMRRAFFRAKLFIPVQVLHFILRRARSPLAFFFRMLRCLHAHIYPGCPRIIYNRAFDIYIFLYKTSSGSSKKKQQCDDKNADKRKIEQTNVDHNYVFLCKTQRNARISQIQRNIDSEGLGYPDQHTRFLTLNETTLSRCICFD